MEKLPKKSFLVQKLQELEMLELAETIKKLSSIIFTKQDLIWSFTAKSQRKNGQSYSWTRILFSYMALGAAVAKVSSSESNNTMVNSVINAPIPESGKSRPRSKTIFEALPFGIWWQSQEKKRIISRYFPGRERIPNWFWKRPHNFESLKWFINF
jgi:hypothetical protein